MRILSTLGFAVLVAAGASDTAQSVRDSFASPELRFRPKFRYWLPDASVPPDIVRKDVASIAGVGAAGIELLPYYDYGCPECDFGAVPPTDWAKYGFGGEAFRQIFLAALEATKDNGVLMDFAQGASEGQGVPAVPGSEGLAVELAYANVTVPAGETFAGALPLSRQPDDLLASFVHQLENFGEQTLFKVTAAQVISESPAGAGGFPTVTLGEILDIASYLGDGNSLNWTAPMDGDSWRIFAWYERHSNQRTVAPGLNATNFIQNGSWLVDHFSASGSQKMTAFLDQHVFPDDHTRALLAEVGEYAWEDSMEMQTALWWTPGFADMFEKDHGYSITQCLPLLITPENFWGQSLVPYGEAFQAQNQILADACSEDYRTTLNAGYQAYLKAYEAWTKTRGIKYSAQPAYNLPMEMLADITLLDAPEGESLGFDNLLDAYRQFAGPAHLAGLRVVSSECGAQRPAAYTQTVGDLLWAVRRGLAGGISMHVLHGHPYQGAYANTTWPGFTAFMYQFTEMWGARQPTWRHIGDAVTYIARNQRVAQAGRAKVDLAFYLYAAPWAPGVQYRSDNLEARGFTYDYLSPSSLRTADAVVGEGVLAPEGPAYKALVFSNQTAISAGAASAVKRFAEEGLPVFFVGDTNFTSIGMKPGEQTAVREAMAAVLQSGLPNVHVVASADALPAALEAANIAPRVAFEDGTSAWYSFYRRSEEDGFDYVFLHNDGNATATSMVNITPSSTVPYVFDAWTGAVEPVLMYTATSVGISLPITLAANQTMILGLAMGNSSADVPGVYVTAAEDGVVGLRCTSSNSTCDEITAYLCSPSAKVTLSDGRTLNLLTNSSVPPATNLTAWDVEIEDWHRTNDTFSTDTAVDVHTYSGVQLQPWSALDSALEGVSGVGRYRTNFTARGRGARLHLGPIANTVRVWLNGRRLPAVDLAHAVADVSGAVREGENGLLVEIATTLFNRIKRDGNATWTAGVTANAMNGAYYERSAYTDESLRGPVWVEWVGVVDVV